MMNSKRGGVLGGFIVMFIAAVIIFAILLILVVGSVVFKNVVREWDNADADINIHDERVTGLGDVFNYMAWNRNFVRVKFLVEDGKSLEEALKEAEYEK